MEETKNLEYVGFWIRTIASIIDSTIIGIIIVPLLIGIYGTEYYGLGADAPIIAGFWDVVISYILPIVVVIVFWRYKSATPGKMVFRAIIVDAKTGKEPSTGQLIGRYFAYFLSTLPFFLGFLWIAFDKRKQGWHDKLSGTVVIREK